jgi:phosphotransferase system  glucose/maltose/N-acetylglucosamine-specific IIC component
MWILLIEIIASPVADIFNKNILWGLGLGGVIATLAMNSFGDNFITWIDSLAQTWYASLLVIVIAIVFGVVYQVIMKTFGKKMKASKLASEGEKTGKAQKVIQTHGRVSRKELESYNVKKK